MPTLLSQKLKESQPLPRLFLWSLLLVINAFLWVFLLAFHWEISLRAREVAYWGTQLFPVRPPKGVPLPVIYTLCALLTLASIGVILRDRSNMAARERIRTLLFQILDSLEIGVVVIDDRHLLAMVNDSARRLLPEIPPGYASMNILEVLKERPGLCEMVADATAKRQYVREIEYDLRTSREPFPVRITTLPLRDPQKHTTGTLLLVHDVRDVVRMERQIRTAERLSALGTLAAAMAHEIRNPLEALDLNLTLLARSLPAPASTEHAAGRTGKYLKILESEISRLAEIVDSFLSFARPGNTAAAEIHLDAILRQIAELLENQARSRKVVFDLSIQPGLVISGSEDQLKQAFLNLVINSLEAMPDGGRLRIQAGAIPPQAGGRNSSNVAVVRIEDTGVGIAQDQLSRLFDPFFTTRPKGIGLGLTIVHRVVQEHHGNIRVESVPGKGSTFTVELPLLAPAGSGEAAG